MPKRPFEAASPDQQEMVERAQLQTPQTMAHPRAEGLLKRCWHESPRNGAVACPARCPMAWGGGHQANWLSSEWPHPVGCMERFQVTTNKSAAGTGLKAGFWFSVWGSVTIRVMSRAQIIAANGLAGRHWICDPNRPMLPQRPSIVRSSRERACLAHTGRRKGSEQ